MNKDTQNIYEVTFISKDNHKFVFKTEAKSEIDAIHKGDEAITKKGWQHFNYVVDTISKPYKHSLS